MSNIFIRINNWENVEFEMEGTNFKVRKARESDIPGIATAASDRDAQKMLEHYIDLSGSAEKRRETIRRHFFQYGYRKECFVILNERDKIVGFRWFEKPWGSVVDNTGCWVHKDYRGTGAGSTSLIILLALLFKYFGVNLVQSGAKVENQASVNNLKKCGFDIVSTRDGVYRLMITLDKFREKYDPKVEIKWNF